MDSCTNCCFIGCLRNKHRGGSFSSFIFRGGCRRINVKNETKDKVEMEDIKKRSQKLYKENDMAINMVMKEALETWNC